MSLATSAEVFRVVNTDKGHLICCGGLLIITVVV